MYDQSGESMVTLLLRQEWGVFYEGFGLRFDIGSPIINLEPAKCGRLLGVSKLMTNDVLFDYSRTVFGRGKVHSWYAKTGTSHSGIVDKVSGVDTRPTADYFVWVIDQINPPETFRNQSAENLSILERRFETWFERLLHGVCYFRDRKAHLDQDDWTMCADSRDSAGDVPIILSSDDRIIITHDRPDRPIGSLRPRPIQDSRLPISRPE